MTVGKMIELLAGKASVLSVSWVTMAICDHLDAKLLISDHRAPVLGRGARREIAVRYGIWRIEGEHITGPLSPGMVCAGSKTDAPGPAFPICFQ
jgi:hypothetical protein